MSYNNGAGYNAHSCSSSIQSLVSPLSSSSESSVLSDSTTKTNSYPSESSDILSSSSDSESSALFSNNTSSTSFNSASKYFFKIVPIAIDKSINTMNVFRAQNKTIEPFQLSTKKSEIMLYSMQTDDLQTSIIEIWCRSQLHDTGKRMTHIAWYNWVMLDVSRRLNQLSQRMCGNTLMKCTLSDLSKRLFYEDNTQRLIEGCPLSGHPLFTSKGRSRLTRLAYKFGDAVCALSEFIDFMQVMKMEDGEFYEFYEELLENKWAISDRIRQSECFFYSVNPLSPFLKP